MKIAISSGHGKYIRGARGSPVPPQLDEVDEARRVVEAVADYLREADVEVETFHDDVSNDQSENLDRIVAWHNSRSRDLDVSVHFNCYDHSAHGTEVLYVTQEELASEVSSAISEAGGFTNRGAKYRGDLAFLNGTSKPAILIETCFCDNTADSNLYNDNFEIICAAIAESISGEEIDEDDRPDIPDLPRLTPVEERLTIRKGDEGPDVEDLQRLLPRFSGEIDGDFGSITDGAVRDYQRSRGLDVDGIVGQQTWTALYDRKRPVPPPPPPPGAFTAAQQERIKEIANSSKIASYDWDDRGEAPRGWTQGMALAFGQTYRKLLADHPAAVEMAKARTNSDKDALNEYWDDFDELGMSNERAGADTLRHLYALMIGHGMRESSGEHCCGRDQSADNVESDTCEAGAFQTSYNASNASDPEFDDLMDEYLRGESPGYLDAFAEEVSCSSSDWESYGSGRGREFQDLCKNQPAFSAESCGLTLRNLCNHYGPIIRHETELREDADVMLKEVQDYVDSITPVTA